MSDLPAGPELDRLVAEKVMGWSGSDHDWLMRHRELDQCHYSTNIAHAWEVVERLRDGLVIFRARDGWHAGVMVNGDGFAEHWIDDSLQQHAIADTAPLTICRAALLAVGA